jgi:glutathione synthetase
MAVRCRSLWITSPWSSLDHPRDTTLRLMTEAQELGWDNLWCDPSTICISEGRLSIGAAPLVQVIDRSIDGFVFGENRAHTLTCLDNVMVRMDPPIDIGYLQTLQVLELGRSLESRKSTVFTNPLEALMASNSKLEPLRIRGAEPPTLVARDWDCLKEFGVLHQRTIVKPLNSCNCDGIQRLDWSTSSGVEHARYVIQLLSNRFAVAVLLQKDLTPSQADEVRLWMLDGDVLAAATKTFKGDFRKMSGLRAATLETSHVKTIAVLRQHLRARRIRLAAVDIIGPAIIDVNFASPGLLVELEELIDTNLARDVIQALAPD